MKIQILNYLMYLAFTFEIVAILWLANKAYAKVYGPIGKIMDGNTAVAIQRLGYIFGCSLAAFSAMEKVSIGGFSQTLWQIFAATSVASIFVLVASFVNDNLITWGIDDNKEIGKGNMSVAIVDASASIATGFITAASFSGSGPWYSPLVFFIVGQIALIISAKVFIHYAEVELAWLENGNTAAGISLGGMIIATGITLRNAISGPFAGWWEDLVAVAISYGVGILLLIMAFAFIPRLFLGTSLRGVIRGGNSAYALFKATLMIITALCVGMIAP